MCFVGDKVSRACIGKAFPYRIPKTLKEAHNLIFFFFLIPFQKLNEKEKSITFEFLEKKR